MKLSILLLSLVLLVPKSFGSCTHHFEKNMEATDKGSALFATSAGFFSLTAIINPIAGAGFVAGLGGISIANLFAKAKAKKAYAIANMVEDDGRSLERRINYMSINDQIQLYTKLKLSKKNQQKIFNKFKKKVLDSIEYDKFYRIDFFTGATYLSKTEFKHFIYKEGLLKKEVGHPVVKEECPLSVNDISDEMIFTTIQELNNDRTLCTKYNKRGERSYKIYNRNKMASMVAASLCTKLQ